MLQNYFKIAIRNLFKNKVHSSINLLGLAFGLACTTLIALWIKRELSVNMFHANKAQLFRILEHQTYGEDIFTFGATPGPLAAKLKADFPEITHVSRVSWGNRSLVTYGNQSFYEQGRNVDPDFLHMFSFPLLKGDPATALSQPFNILITKRTADKYFPNEDPIGKTLKLENTDEYTVAGILADIPENSSFQFDYLTSLENFEKRNEWMKTWNNNSIQTYFMTQSGVTADAITQKIKTFIADNSEQKNVELLAHPLPDWYLRFDFKDGKYQGGGQIQLVRMFGIIAIFILLIACINFMNLSTAKSATRAMEVGVRKVSGATRGLLAAQFLSESMVVTVLAGIIGIALASMTLPYFNHLFDLKLSLNMAGMEFWFGLAGVVLLTGLVAGSYPALFLSGFQPVKVLKGLVKTGGSAVTLRKVLVTAQFVISVFLIISTLVVYKQLQYIKNKNLGYDKENLVYMPVNGTLFEKYDALKTDLLQLPSVTSVTTTNGQIHAWGNNTSNVSWPGKDPEQDILFQTIPVGYDFLKTIGAQLKEGRDFSKDFPTDSVNYVINETAARLMGLENPVGETISLWDTPGHVVGLVKDFHVGSFQQKQDPVLMILGPWKNFVYVRLKPTENMSSTLASVGAVFQKINPAYPFEYHFTDKEYEEMHRSEKQTGQLAEVFAFLAIFVSCLGLFGLAAFATEQRRKEIGIRKVLGATVGNLTGLLSKDFLQLVALAILLASPLAWWAMTGWLDDFAFHVELRWWYFAAAGIVAIAVAFLTVSFQSVKAALANPVKSLRSE
ncbi:MAG: ABC transporter permease [Lewinellaceae bacterium]|nr:ABC transporter permease [Saprospiraceae bacterium]MCB9341250.1 ABC transporter permease [Lewinellaceae bacterium]